MLQHLFAPQQQQRRRFNVNTWNMPSSSFGMSPFESCFMPSMLDILEPLLDLSRNINVGRGVRGRGRSQPQQQRWKRPSSQVRQNVRSKSQTRMNINKPSFDGAIGDIGFQKPMLPKTTVSKEMPQKYRIAIDCCGFKQQDIRTCVKNINGVFHLIVSCCSSGKQSRGVGGVGTVSTEFRRSYTLPRNCNIKSMCKYMCNGLFVIEFPLFEKPVLVNCAKLKPTVVKCQGTKMVSLRVPIPELVNRTNLQCFVKDRDLILRFEYKIQPDTVSRVYCYTKIPLPAQTNLNQLKCKLNKKRLLTVCAPLIVKTTGVRPTMAKFRCIHIERKLRHRISGKVSLIGKEIFGKQQIKGKKSITTGGKKPITGQKPGQVKDFGKKEDISKSNITKKTSGVFGELFGKVPAKPKQQVTGRKEKKTDISGQKTPDVLSKTKNPVVQKKTDVKPGHVVSGQTPIKKTRSGTDIKSKTSGNKNLFETGKQQQGTTRRTGLESNKPLSGGISSGDTLHRIIGSERKSPETERRGSPEGRKSPIRSSVL